MDGKDADATVGIGVGPGVRNGCVVDGQQLQYALTSLDYQVYHHLQIAEITNTRTVLASQREYGYQCACQFVIVNLEKCLIEMIYHYLALRHGGQTDATVVATFPLLDAA